jgi:hypothetical protein
VEEKISFPIAKAAPENFKRYGEKLIRYKANH